MPKLRIFYAADFHGSDLCFRKFLGAARTFEPDALILGGDLTGKALVPIVRDGSRYLLYSGEEPVELTGKEAVASAERTLGDSGRYAVRLDDDRGLEKYLEDDDYRQRLLREAALQRVEAWISRSEELLPSLGVECYIMAGNDDHDEIIEALDASSYVVNHDERVTFIRDSIPLLGLGSSNPTPFHSPRELTESEIATRLEQLFEEVPESEHTILNTHCPPYRTGLDFAPELGPDNEIISYGGQPRMTPVGSTAVLDAVESFQPLASLHGHCHESKQKKRIGSTTCVNPGSLYMEGILSAAIVDINSDQTVRCQFVSG